MDLERAAKHSAYTVNAAPLVATAVLGPISVAVARRELAELRDTLFAEIDDAAKCLSPEDPADIEVRHLRFGPVAEQLLTAAQQTSQAARGSRGRGRRRGRGRGDGGGSANDNAEPSLPPLSAALPDLATLRELFPLPPPGDLTAAPPSAAGPVSAPGPGATPESGVQALTLPPITAPNPGSQAPPLPLLPPLPPLPPLPALQPPPAVQGGQEAVTRRHRERVKEAASWLCSIKQLEEGGQMHRSLNPKSSRLRETLVGPELSALHAAHATAPAPTPPRAVPLRSRKRRPRVPMPSDSEDWEREAKEAKAERRRRRGRRGAVGEGEEGAGEVDRIPANDVLVRFAVFSPGSLALSARQEILLTSSQPLTDLFDAITCPVHRSLERVAGAVSGGYVYANGHLYPDTRRDDHPDYISPILAFCHQHGLKTPAGSLPSQEHIDAMQEGQGGEGAVQGGPAVTMAGGGGAGTSGVGWGGSGGVGAVLTEGGDGTMVSLPIGVGGVTQGRVPVTPEGGLPSTQPPDHPGPSSAPEPPFAFRPAPASGLPSVSGPFSPPQLPFAHGPFSPPQPPAGPAPQSDLGPSSDPIARALGEAWQAAQGTHPAFVSQAGAHDTADGIGGVQAGAGSAHVMPGQLSSDRGAGAAGGGERNGGAGGEAGPSALPGVVGNGDAVGEAAHDQELDTEWAHVFLGVSDDGTGVEDDSGTGLQGFLVEAGGHFQNSWGVEYTREELDGWDGEELEQRIARGTDANPPPLAPLPPRLETFVVIPMHQARVRDLWCCLGTLAGNLLVHAGCCEHVMAVVDVRLPHADDDLRAASYPKVVCRPKQPAMACQTCRSTANVVVFGSPSTPSSPCYLCHACNRALHYDAQGQRLGLASHVMELPC